MFRKTDNAETLQAPVERRGGHNRKTLEQHLKDGTYNATRHGPKLSSRDIGIRPEAQGREACGDPRRWCQSAADEYAVSEGCWFDERRAAYVVDWFAEHLRHSQGRWAGKPFQLLDFQRQEIIYPLFGWHCVDETGAIVRRFNRAFVLLPKKNGKSTLASGIGLYMLCAEGNRGAEVYSAATDRDQASIVHGEAIRMVEASLKLRWFLKINHTTKHIYNHEMGLCYKALSHRPRGSEGLKGNCCIIDELHAWYGDELWNALRYMGINWPERLIFVITTAGDDTESICYKQYDLAKRVLSGEAKDYRLLGVIHEAAAEEDLTSPEVQRKANPALGELLRTEDLKEQIVEAENQPREMVALKRYRFNIWQTSSSPWLDMVAWKQCLEPIADEALEEFRCFAGLDLARVRDMTAFALLFEDDELAHVRVWYWLPEERIRQLRTLLSVEQWVKDGWLRICGQSDTDFSIVEKDVAELVNRFRPAAMAFDPMYAKELTQRLEDSTGLERVEFTQTMLNFAGPTAAFERMVIDGKLRHDGNPILSWQAGNAMVRTDTNQNIRPDRQNREDHKTIDGVVASIMALGLSHVYESQQLDYYEEHELEAF